MDSALLAGLVATLVLLVGYVVVGWLTIRFILAITKDFADRHDK